MEITSASLVERLQKLSSSAISDVLDVSGYTGQSLSGTIRPLVPTMRFAGFALCFSGVSETPGDTTPALSSYEIDQRITPGLIVLIVAGLNAGAPRDQVFAANPRFDHIRRLR